MQSLSTLVLAWISRTLTAGSRVRSRLVCWFILLFIQTMASFTCFSTRVTSSSSKWLYCSSCWEKHRYIMTLVWRLFINNLTLKTACCCPNCITNKIESSKHLVKLTNRLSVPGYLCLVSFDDLHVQLDLSAKLLKCFWPLLSFHVSLKNWLANFLWKMYQV